jgi:hypothetical protein
MMPPLDSDTHLERVPQVEGYRVLPPCVLYGKIGQGGMGAVYRGRHLNLDIDVAVKCLKPELVGGDEQFVVRFRREARAAAQINHQNVIRVFDVAEEKGLHYIVMELVQGETARERVQRKKQLGIGEALEIAYRAAQGLGEAHRKGFIHRDIKPDNIMISSSGQVKVADLGLAKPSLGDGQGSMLSGTNIVMGTPQYMPPEQWENTATVTPAADVWALGATMFYLFVGGEAIAKDSLPRIMQRIVMQPFPDVRQRRADVPEDVAKLIAKATAQRPEDRFADAGELAEAIEGLATRREALRDRDAAPTSEQYTLLSPPPAKTLARIKFWLDEQGQAVPAPAGKSAAPSRAIDTKALLAGLCGVVVVVLLAWWQPWRGAEDAFAQADRLERAGDYPAAIEAAERAYAADATLEGQSPGGRAARLARLHAAEARAKFARGDAGAALAAFDRSLAIVASPAVRTERADVLRTVARDLDRALVRSEPAAVPVAAGAVVFGGRLDHPLARRLLLGGAEAARAEDGSFRESRDPGGQTSMAVAVELTVGDVVALPAWTFVVAAPLPVAATPPTTTPTGTARSGNERPATPDAPALRFVVPPTPQGVKLLADRRAAIAADRVVVEGDLGSRADEVLLGQAALDVEWTGGRFRCVVPLTQLGENVLEFTARRAAERATTRVAIVRLGPPALALAGPCRDGDRTAEAVYRLLVSGDEWTARVVVRHAGTLLVLQPTPGEAVFRGDVPLELGPNALVVEAVDVLEQRSRLALTVERVPPAARPKLQSIELVVGAQGRDGRSIEVLAGRQVFLSRAARLRVAADDPAAAVSVNEAAVPRADDGTVDLAPFLTEGQHVAIDVAVVNAAGRSEPFRFFPMLDSGLPSIVMQLPNGPVAAGRAFDVRGTWVDPGGLASFTVDGQPAIVTPGRGAARQGDWMLRHPGLPATQELRLVVEDRAGNRLEQVLRVEVQ